MAKITLPAREIEISAEYDVLVCGAGLSGIAAAVNAARAGLKVGMVEYFGKVGGIPVSGQLGVISGYIFGLKSAFTDLLRERARACNGINDEKWCMTFDPEKLNQILLRLLEENHIEVHLYTQLIAAVRQGEKLEYAVVANKSGVFAVKARLFVDDTGDGDLAVYAGCEYEMGRPADGKVQSSSMTFQVGGIEADKIIPMSEMSKLWREFPHNVPINHMVVKYAPAHDGTLDGYVNMTHTGGNPLLAEDQLRIRQQGIAQAYEIVEFMRAHIPGYAHAYLANTAMQLGVRESRRIMGDYVLTTEDVLNGRDFPDEIARCGWSIDIHSPDGYHTGIDSSPKMTKTYAIPYRCLTPRGVRNLLIAGRPISVSWEAFSSSRINSTCICIGEAVGMAAPLAVKSGDTRKIDIAAVQNALEKTGTTVHQPLKD